MKKLLLLLCALIFAAPVWADDIAGAPANPPASASSAQAAPTVHPGKETPKKAQKKKKKKKAKSASTDKSVLSCPTGCALTHCPAPVGPIVCCKNNMPC